MFYGLPLVEYQLTVVGFEPKIMHKFSINDILDIGYGKYRKSLTSIFWLKSLEKSIALRLREFTCSLVKTLRVLLRKKENWVL